MTRLWAGQLRNLVQFPSEAKGFLDSVHAASAAQGAFYSMVSRGCLLRGKATERATGNLPLSIDEVKERVEM